MYVLLNFYFKVLSYLKIHIRIGLAPFMSEING